jgi:excisionase family DNA binding protein
MEEKIFISTSDLAKLLGISRIAVYKKIKSDKIKAGKAGHNFIINRKGLPKILGSELGEDQKAELDKAVEKTVKEYGETLRMLGRI